MSGCQDYGPFLGPSYNAAPIIKGTQKGTPILTTTHMKSEDSRVGIGPEISGWRWLGGAFKAFENISK